MRTYRSRAEAIEEARENSATLEENTHFVSSRYIARTPGRRYAEFPYDAELPERYSIVGVYRHDTGFESFTGK